MTHDASLGADRTAPAGPAPRSPAAGSAAARDVERPLSVGDEATAYQERVVAPGVQTAVQVVRTDAPLDAERRSQIDRIVRQASRLHHANLVSVHALRWLPDGALALLLECVDGERLRDVLRDGGALPTADAVLVLQEIVRALGVAEERARALGVPPAAALDALTSENVYLAHSGNVLLDVHAALLGLATRAPTPAPERARGEHTARSTVYALGQLGWEMLVGPRPPWIGAEHDAEGEEWWRATPIPDELSPAVVEVLQAALEDDPARRWRTPDAFVAALVAAQESCIVPLDQVLGVGSSLGSLEAYLSPPAVAARAAPGARPAGGVHAPSTRLGAARAAVARRPLGFALAVAAAASVALGAVWWRAAAPGGRPPRTVASRAPAIAGRTTARPATARPATAPSGAAPQTARPPIAAPVRIAAASGVALPLAPPPRTATAPVSSPSPSPVAVASSAPTPPRGAPRPTGASALPSAVSRSPLGPPVGAPSRSLASVRAALRGVASWLHLGGGGAPPAVAPDSTRAAHRDFVVARVPRPVGLLGTWSHGDGRSKYGDSLMLALDADGRAALEVRQYVLNSAEGWRLTRVWYRGTWVVHYPPAGRTELCLRWHSPVDEAACESFIVDSLSTERMMKFGGRYWRTRLSDSAGTIADTPGARRGHDSAAHSKSKLESPSRATPRPGARTGAPGRAHAATHARRGRAR